MQPMAIVRPFIVHKQNVQHVTIRLLGDHVTVRQTKLGQNNVLHLFTLRLRVYCATRVNFATENRLWKSYLRTLPDGLLGDISSLF